MTETLNETAPPDAPETPETPVQPPEEPDTPDTPEEPEAPEEEPEQPVERPGSNETEAEAIFDAARRRAKTYMRDVPKILGPHAADMSLCPLCTDLIPGFVLPAQVKPVVGDQLLAVKAALGEGLPIEYVNADDASQCQACRGEGKVRTGSHVPKQDVLRCRHCEGRGWIGPRAVALSHSEPVENGHVHDEYAPHIEEPPQLDPWGRTVDDPLYGVMPGFVRS